MSSHTNSSAHRVSRCLSVALCSLPLVIAGCIDDAETGGVTQHTSATSAVQLLHANVYSSAAPGELANAHLNGYVEVDTSSGDRQVDIVYTVVDSGTWETAPASFVSVTTEGRERWFFVLPDVPYDHAGGDNITFRLAVRYTSDAGEQWDNNGGADYRLGVGPDLGRQFVLGKPAVFVKNAGTFEYQDRCSFVGQLVLKNLGYTKNVNIVYTTDDWATTKVGAASYDDGPYFNNNSEDWSFNLTVPGAPAEVSFAVAYDVNGVTYWDNNFGANYQLTNCSDYFFW